jgi:hypothetical protein
MKFLSLTYNNTPYLVNVDAIAFITKTSTGSRIHFKGNTPPSIDVNQSPTVIANWIDELASK